MEEKQCAECWRPAQKGKELCKDCATFDKRQAEKNRRAKNRIDARKTNVKEDVAGAAGTSTADMAAATLPLGTQRRGKPQKLALDGSGPIAKKKKGKVMRFKKFIKESHTEGLITTTKTGDIEIWKADIKQATKTKLNKQLDKIYKSTFGESLASIMDKVEKCLNDNDFTPVDEEYSAGWSSFNLGKEHDAEISFQFGELSSIEFVNDHYKPVTMIVTNCRLKMFIHKEAGKTKVESIYIS